MKEYICEVCGKIIEGAMVWNKKTRQFECNDCYLSEDSKIE